MGMQMHNRKSSQTPAELNAGRTKRPANETSLITKLFGKDVYDQLIRERNLRLLDEPFSRAMMMAGFRERTDGADGNSEGGNGSSEAGEDETT